MGTTATVLGATGYSGGELLRLLAGHPDIDVLAVAGGARAGADTEQVLPHLAGTGLAHVVTLEEGLGTGADVCFSCLPSGVLPVDAADAERVIDLSDDHRDDPDWVYGLTEFNREDLAGATFVANPGCYPTASLLGLVPFFAAGVVEGPVVIDALSGVSGAGRKADDKLSFATAFGSATAYGDVDHRHVPEIERGLGRIAGTEPVVSFTPHLAPMSRGLLVTARARLTEELSDEQALSVLEKTYGQEPFVHVVDGWPSTKAVAGSNHAHVSARVDRRAGLLVASAAIDNLGKGAAGQALQNANLCLGLDETTGLQGLGVWP